MTPWIGAKSIRVISHALDVAPGSSTAALIAAIYCSAVVQQSRRVMQVAPSVAGASTTHRRWKKSTRAGHKRLRFTVGHKPKSHQPRAVTNRYLRKRWIKSRPRPENNYRVENDDG